MAEMTLMKLGEILELPQAKRAKLIERQAEESRRAREARAQEERRSVADYAERERQATMNEQAYVECRGRWEQLTTAMLAGGYGLHDGARALAKRVAHRAELKLVTTAPEEVRRLAPGSFVAMGTSGLEPTELRAVMHALVLAATPGAAAHKFLTMVEEKVMALDDFAPTAFDMFNSPTEDAPLGFASGRGTTVRSRTRSGASSSASNLPVPAPSPPPASGANEGLSSAPPLPPPPPPPPPVPLMRSRSASAGGGGGDSHSDLLQAIQNNPRARLRSASSCSLVAHVDMAPGPAAAHLEQ
jgi:hypothetical protein